jgi:hypothetical protein
VGSSTHCHRLGIHVINRKVGETRLSLGLLRLLGVSPVIAIEHLDAAQRRAFTTA